MANKKNKRGSIHNTLMSWFLLLSLIPLVFISFFGYYQTSSSLISAAKKELEHSADLTTRFINNWMKYRFMDVNTLANSHDSLTLLTAIKNNWQNSSLPLDKFVQTSQWESLNDNKSEESLYHYSLTYDYVYDAYLIDNTGNVLYSINKGGDLGQNINDELLKSTLLAESTHITLSTKKINFSGIERYKPDYDALTGFITAPILDKDNNLQGAVAVQITLEHLFYLLAATSNENGTLKHYLVGEDHKLRTPFTMNNWQEILVKEIHSVPVVNWKHNENTSTPYEHTSIYKGPEGNKVIGHQQEVSFSHFNWLLISELHFDQANHSANTLKRVTVIFFIFIAWLVFLISFTLSKRLTKPLIQLTEFAEDIQHGIKHQKSLTEEIKSNDEIGTLVEAFDNMVLSKALHEQALKESTIKSTKALAALAEQRFALDQHAIVAITDIKGTITFANSKFAEISGYSIEELVGSNHSILNSAYHPPEFFQEMYDTITKGKVWKGEIRNITKNGQYYWLDTTVVPFMDKNNKPLSYISIRSDITQRKNTELYLEENTKQLELVINATQVGFWDWQMTTGEVDCTSRWYNILGYERDDFPQLTVNLWSSLLHPDDLITFNKAMKQLMAGQIETFSSEIRVKHKNGDWVWVADSGKVVEKENGVPTRMIGTLLDISQLKETEQGLARIQAFSTGIFDSVADGIISIDKNGLVQSFNPAAEAMYGYSQDEVVGNNVSMIIPEHIQDSVNRAINKFSQLNLITSLNKPIEAEGQSKDGRIFPIELTISKVTIENEMYFTALSRDITLRKAEELKQKQLYQKSQVKLAIAKIMATQDDLKTRINESLKQTYKLHKLGIVSQATIILAEQSVLSNEIFSSYGVIDYETCYTKEFATINHEISAKAVALGQSDYQQHCQLSICKNTYKHDHGHYCIPLVDKTDNDNELLGILIISSVDNHIFNDEDNMIFNEIASILSVAIIRENAKELLKQASITAQQNSQLKSEFLASMSHEIRTPMNGVLGMLGLLLNSQLTKDQAHKAQIAKLSAESLLTLINDILDFSKVEAGKMELDIIEFNIHEMFGELAEVMAHKAQDKGLEIILDVTEIEQSLIKADPHRIRQVLTNLVGNAIKFTPSGEIVIRAKTTFNAQQQMILSCEVQDTGIGIPETKLNSLFNAFTQVDASTTRQFGGTGLGLSICKKLVELMKGDINATSTHNQGSVFSFHVLVEESEQSQIVKPSNDISSQHFLIVDDNQTASDVLSKQLKHWGAKVTLTTNAKDALRICEESQKSRDLQAVNMVFIDMYMEDMSGIHLAKALTEGEHFDKIKLVMMTTISQGHSVKYLTEMGLKTFFPKPATTADLIDALSTLTRYTSSYLPRLGGTETNISTTNIEPVTNAQKEQELKELTENSTIKSIGELSNTSEQIQWPENTRILLVEDNRVNQMVALGILKEFNLNASVANNGLEALEVLSDTNTPPYNLILMDCQMPEMDGYQATKAIRANKSGDMDSAITIIAMTANAMEGDKEKCLRAGMNDYLTKPIDSEILLLKLTQWLILGPSSTVETNLSTDTDTSPLLVATEQTKAITIWHRASALKRVRGNEKLLAKLMNVFIESMPELTADMNIAAAENNIKDVHRIAHTIKGSAGNLSGLILHEKAAALELMAKQESMPSALVESVNDAVNALVAHLKAELS